MVENIFIESSTKGAFRVNLSLQNTDGKSIFSASINSDDLQSESYENILADNDYSFVALSPVKDANNKQCGVSVNFFAPLKQGQKWCLAVNGDAGNYMAYCDYGEFDKGDSISTIASTACGQLPISVGAYVSRNKFMNIDNKERSFNWVLGERYPLSGVGPTSDGRNKPDVLAPGAYIISAINNYAASYNIDKGDLVCREKDELNPKRTNFWGQCVGLQWQPLWLPASWLYGYRLILCCLIAGYGIYWERPELILMQKADWILSHQALRLLKAIKNRIFIIILIIALNLAAER